MRVGAQITVPTEKLQDNRSRKVLGERVWCMIKEEIEKYSEIMEERKLKKFDETRLQTEVMVLTPRGLEEIRGILVDMATLNPHLKDKCEEIDQILTNRGL